MGATAELTAAASAVVEVIDARARVIKLRRPGALAQFRLVEAVGPEVAKNQVYMLMALPVIYVTAIDGDAVQMPRSKLELESLIQRLEEDGIDAVNTGVRENFGKVDPNAEAQALKN